MISVPALAAANDGNVEEDGLVHFPEFQWQPGIYYRNAHISTPDIDDNDTPYFYVACWANDITGAQFNTSANGWSPYLMNFDVDSGYKSYWRTADGIVEIQNMNPGDRVSYDFRVWDGADDWWLGSDGTETGYRAVSDYGMSDPWSFTIEGIMATPATALADSSSAVTIKVCVTNNGQPVSGEVVTLSFTSGPGAFKSNNNRTITSATNSNGITEVLVWSGYAGNAVVKANSTNLANCSDTEVTVSFSTFLTDGYDTDFPGHSRGMGNNESRVVDGAFVWKDAEGDGRPDAEINGALAAAGTSIDNFDIREMRVAASSDSFRVLMAFKNNNLGVNPYVFIAIDTNVTRDTSSAVTGPGPGPASSVADYGNWWFPANAQTGTRHLGVANANNRGERSQLDKTGTSDGYLPNRWGIDGSNIDGPIAGDSTATSNWDRGVTTNRRDNSAGGTNQPRQINWDYNHNTNELYVGITDFNNGGGVPNGGDHYIFIADETSTVNNTWPAAAWNKAGRVMSFDWFFAREGSGNPASRYCEARGKNWDSTYAQGSGGGTYWNLNDALYDFDNRPITYVSCGNPSIPLEGIVDLDEAMRDTWIKNGDIYVAAASYGTNNGDGNWDGVPDDYWDNNVLEDTRVQKVVLENSSLSSDEQVCEWERCIAFNPTDPGGGRSSTLLFRAPGGRSLGHRSSELGRSYMNTTNADSFEYDISWRNLLGDVNAGSGTGPRPPFTLRLTVGIGWAATGGSDEFDTYRYTRVLRSSGTDAWANTSGFLDVISNAASTSAELSDSDIDYFIDIDFNQDGRVNTTPDTPTNRGITQTGDATVKGPNSIINDLTPTFTWSWNDTDGVLSIKYPAWQVQIDDDPNFGSPAQTQYTQDSSTSWTSPALASGNLYYWRVRTRDDFGWGPWSASTGADSFPFRTNQTPTVPTNLKVNDQVNPTALPNNSSIKFSWTFNDPDPGDAQDGYIVEIYKNRTTLHYAFAESRTFGYVYYPDTAPGLEGGITYYWRVRTQDQNDAVSVFSDSTATTFMIEFDSTSAVRNLVIAEVGQNGTTGDYVMIYNPSDTIASLKGMSLQRWSATLGTTFRKQVYGYRDTIPAYSYFLVASGGGVAGFDTTFVDSSLVTGAAMALALVRNGDDLVTGDTDRIDAVSFGGPEGEGAALGNLTTNGWSAIRCATQSSATQTLASLCNDSDLRWAGHSVDANNNATDFVGVSALPGGQRPRGRSSGPSRIKLALTATPAAYIETGVPFTLRITARDANDTVVSPNASMSLMDSPRISLTAGSLNPSAVRDTFNTFSGSNPMNGIVEDSFTYTGALGQVVITADTTFGMDSTGLGAIRGSCTLIVQTAVPPTKPVLSYPLQGYSVPNPLTISWAASTDSTPPVRYRVQVSRSDTFGWLAADTFTYATSQAMGDLSVPDSWYVRVVAYDPGGNSDTSTAVNFRAVYAVTKFDLSESDPQLLVQSRAVRRGQAFNLRIIARDASGNKVTTFQDTVTLTIGRGTILPATVKFWHANAGETTCSVTISGAAAVGRDTLQVESGTLICTIYVVPLSDNRLVINEVLPVDINTPGGDDKDEWVEIHNRSRADVSTNGWVLSDGEDDINLPNVTIPSGKYMVVHTNETGPNDTDFGDTDGAAHIFPFTTVTNRLSATDDLRLYASTTLDSSTIASYMAFTNGASWGGQLDADAVGAGVWVNDQTVDVGTDATGLQGRPIFRPLNGVDTYLTVSDWMVQSAAETYVMTEGCTNLINDTSLTGVTIKMRSANGSFDTVAVGETVLISLRATGGGNAAVRNVATVRVWSLFDTQGIVVTLLETDNDENVFTQEIRIVSKDDSVSLDGHRWLEASLNDSITAQWVKGGETTVAAVPAPLAGFSLSAPTSISNGFSFALTITAVTRTGTRKEDYTGTVNLTVAIGSIAPLSTTFAASDSGQKTVAVTVTGATVGTTDTILATEASTGETGRVVVNVVAAPSVVINEIMPLPAGTNWDGDGTPDINRDEWMEIFNRTDSGVNLIGWKLGATGTSKVTLSGTLDTRGFAVVYRRGSGSALIQFFDSAGVYQRGWTCTSGAMGPLNNGGDRVFLLNAAGDTIDDVTYASMSAYPDSTYARAWDGAGVWRYPVRATPGDSPTLPADQRDSNPNMRFRIDLPATAKLDESRTLYVVAVDARNETVTNFTQSGVLVRASGGPTINIASIDFTAGICSTSIRFQTVNGVVALTVRHDTTTVGYKEVAVSDAWYINDGTYDGNDSFCGAVGNDANHGRTPSKPKLTIAAVLPLLSSNETVFIDAGTFSHADSIWITKDGVTFQGRDSSLTIIDFEDSTQDRSIKTHGGYDQLIVKDLTLFDGRYGVWIQGGDTCRVERVTAKHMAQHGFYIEPNGGDVPESNLVLNCHFWKVGNGVMHNSTVRRNTYLNVRTETATGQGFDIVGASETNVFHGCAASQCATGFRIGNTSYGNQLQSCTSSANTWYGYEITNAGQSFNTIAYSRAERNSNNGFHISDGADSSTFLRNVSSRNLIAGWHIHESVTLSTFTENVAESNAQTGFSIDNADFNTFTSNLSYGNGWDGFKVTNFANYNTFRADTSRQDTSYGFYVLADSNTFIDCLAESGTSTDGLKVEGGDSNLFRNCTVRGVQGAGIILVSGSERNHFQNCVVRDAKSCGFWTQTDRNTFDSCTVDSALAQGVYFDGADHCTFLNGYVVWARDNGILGVNGACTNLVRGTLVELSKFENISFATNSYGNIVESCTSQNAVFGYGIKFDQSNNNTARLNRIDSNNVGIFLWGARSCIIDTNFVTRTLNKGIQLENSCTFTVVRGNTVYGSGNDGILFANDSDSGLCSGNEVRGNGASGISVWECMGLVIQGNTFDTNTNNGIWAGGGSWSNNLRVENNRCANNKQSGISFSNVGGSQNIVVANEIDSNGDWGIYFSNTVWNAVVEKNNINQKPSATDRAIENDQGGMGLLARRNWWNRRDTAAIFTSITGGGRTLTSYTPFRLGRVDTSVGADTVAPKAPDTVAALAIGGETVQVTWAPVSSDEEGDPNPTSGAGYRVYRSLTSDTSEWILRGQVDTPTQSFVDSQLTQLTTYHYRVTCYDNNANFPNESYWSDSIASATPVDTTGANKWYVNDGTYDGNDSYCSTIGNDANRGLLPSEPKLTLGAVLPFLTDGDTVLIDAGTFTPTDTLTIAYRNSIWVLGVDSSRTIIDFGDSTQASYKSFFCTQANRVTVRDFTVKNAWIGVYYKTVDTGEIARVRATRCGEIGIILETSADSNLVTGCHADSNGNHGFYLGDGNFNLLWGNTADTNRSIGFLLTAASDSNTLQENLARDNHEGYKLEGTSIGNTFYANTSQSHSGASFVAIAGSSYNIFTSNMTVGDAGQGFYVDGGATNLLFVGNNVTSNASDGFYISDERCVLRQNVVNYVGGYAYHLNWANHCTLDTNQAIHPTGIGIRLVDADTNILRWNAVHQAQSDGIKIEWSDYNLIENCTTYMTKSAGYVCGGSAIMNHFKTCTGTQDTIGFYADAFGTNNYERIYLDDPKGNGFMVLAEGDTFTRCTVNGADNRGFYLLNQARRNLFETNHVIASASTGFDATENSDSNVFRWNRVSTSVGAIGFQCDNSDGNRFEYNYAENTAGDGFKCANGADSNSFFCDSSYNASLSGFATLLSSINNLFTSCTAVAPQGSAGFYLNSDSNTVLYCRSDTANGTSFLVTSANTCTVAYSTSYRAGSTGFGLATGDRNVLRGNFAAWSGGNNFNIDNGSDSNILENNYSRGAGSDGFKILDADFNVLSGNKAETSTFSGFAVMGGSYANVFSGNACTRAATSGFHIEQGGNQFYSNRASNCSAGYTLIAVSNVVLVANQADSCSGWSAQVQPGCGSLTLAKNNFLPAPGDTNCLSVNTAGVSVERNWFGTTDTAAIYGRIGGTERATADYTPFRLGAVDTAIGADTTAPRAPDTVAAVALGPSSIRVTWPSVSADEEADGFATAATGYRVYGSPTADTTQWILRGSVPVGTHSYDDSGLTSATTYYYRVTSYDNASPFENQSFYSDSIASALTTADTNGPNEWYLNDTATTADSFTFAIGDDANNGLTRWTPKKTYASLRPFLTAGDTVNIDAGTYTESFVVETSSIFLRGNSESRPQIRPAAPSETALLVRNMSWLYATHLNIESAYVGIDLTKADSACILHCIVSSADQAAIVIAGGSQNDSVADNLLHRSFADLVVVAGTGTLNNRVDSNVVQYAARYGFSCLADSNQFSRNVVRSCDSSGVWVSGDSNLITGDSIADNKRSGVSLLTTANDNLVFDCFVDSNVGNGIEVAFLAHRNRIDSNTVMRSESHGIRIAGDSTLARNNDLDTNRGGILIDRGDTCWLEGNWVHNTYSASNYGISLTNVSDSNTIYNNVIDRAAGYSLVIAASKYNVIDSNVITNGSDYGIFHSSRWCHYVNNLVSAASNAGMYFSSSADSSWVIGNTFINTGGAGLGINLAFGTNNTIARNVFDGNAGHHIQIDGDSNFVDSNTLRNGLGYGIYVRYRRNTFVNNSVESTGMSAFFSSGGDTNLVVGNTFRFAGAGAHGIELSNAHFNEFRNNRTESNANHGISLTNSRLNLFTQNQSSGNGGYAVRIAGTSALDTFQKNVLLGGTTRPDSGVLNASASTLDFMRNWWDTRDTSAIARRVVNTGGGSVSWTPFRLGAVDTDAGDDTVAPEAPDTVTAMSLGPSSIRVQWTPMTTDEEPDPNATNLSGYRIYIAPTADTSWWQLKADVGSGTTSWDDSGLTAATTYYYRVTSYDNASPFENQSFYSDSIASATTTNDSTGPNVWYINDATYDGSDSYTSAVGNDGNNGLTPATPKLTLGAVLPLLTRNDTVYIDAGTFNPTETAIIETYVYITGVDSYLTIIDFGDSTQASCRSFLVRNDSWATLTRFAVQNAWAGIRLVNSDTCLVESVAVSYCRDAGIELNGGSDSNRINFCHVQRVANGATDSSAGILVTGTSRQNEVSNFVLEFNQIGVLILARSDTTLVRNGRIESSVLYGAQSGTTTVACYGVIFRNLVFDSAARFNSSPSTVWASRGLYIPWSVRMLIDSCAFLNLPNRALDISGQYDTVMNCSFYRIGEGIVTAWTYSYAMNCRIESTTFANFNSAGAYFTGNFDTYLDIRCDTMAEDGITLSSVNNNYIGSCTVVVAKDGFSLGGNGNNGSGLYASRTSQSGIYISTLNSTYRLTDCYTETNSGTGFSIYNSPSTYVDSCSSRCDSYGFSMNGGNVRWSTSIDATYDAFTLTGEGGANLVTGCTAVNPGSRGYYLVKVNPGTLSNSVCTGGVPGAVHFYFFQLFGSGADYANVNNCTSYYAPSHAFYATNASTETLYIDSNAIFGPGGRGIYLSGNNPNCRITNNRISRAGSIGIEIGTGSYNCYLQGNTVETSAADTSISINGSDSVRIVDCVSIDDTTGIAFVNGSDTGLARNNIIYRPKRYGVLVGPNCPNAILDSNTVAGSLLWGFFIAADSHTVVSNVLDSSKWQGMYFFFADTNYIAGNTVRNSWNGSYGFTIDGGYNNLIYNNVVDSSSSYGIYLQSTGSNNRVDSNDIKNGLSYGFYASSSQDSLTITNNLIRDNKGIGLILIGSDSGYIAGNRITNSWSAAYGLYLAGTVNNLVYNNIIDSVSSYGIRVEATGDRNVIDSNTVTNGLSDGINVTADSNVFTGNYVYHVRGDGLYLNNADTNHFNGNRFGFGGNNTEGIYLSNSQFNSFFNNRTDSFGRRGVYLNATSINNLFDSNLIEDHRGPGIHAIGDSNAYTRNTVRNNQGYGLHLAASDTNLVFANTLDSNVQANLFADSAYGNRIESNAVVRGLAVGAWIDGCSTSIVRGNLFSSNASHGVRLESSVNVLIHQNHFVDNAGYGLRILPTCAADTLWKNNLEGSAANPDSSLWNTSTSPLDARRNWWGTRDTTVIARRAVNTGGAALTHTPFRLSMIDTSASDTVAPSAPDSISARALTDTAARIEWSTPATDEEADDFATALTGFRVWRSKVADTSVWDYVGSVSTGETGLVDSGLTSTTYFFKVTTYDDLSPYFNQSFYSDSTATCSIGNASMALTKTIRTVTLGGSPSRPLPGSTVEFELTYWNIGLGASDTVIIRDSIPVGTTFSTASRMTVDLGASATFHDTLTVNGWVFQYATIASPDQNDTSADYTIGFPADPTTVRWVRWMRRTVAAGQTATIRFRVILE